MIQEVTYTSLCITRVMTTPAMSARVRPVLVARIKDEIAAGRAKDKTEVIERGLCRYFGLEYEPMGVKRSKGV